MFLLVILSFKFSMKRSDSERLLAVNVLGVAWDGLFQSLTLSSYIRDNSRGILETPLAKSFFVVV